MNKRELYVVFFSVVPDFSLVFIFSAANAGIVEDESAILVSLLLRVLKVLHIVLCTVCLRSFHQKQEMFIQVLRGGTVAVVLGNFKQTV